jgi:hypothetical protein
MVYASVVEDQVTLNYAPEQPKVAAVITTPIGRSMASWRDRVDPPQEEQPQETLIDPNARPSHNGLRFIGWISDSATGEFSAILQDEKTGNQGWWHKGQKRDDIEVKALVGNKIAVTFADVGVTLVQTEAINKAVRTRAGQPAARPGVSPAQAAATASRASPATGTASTSVRIVENPTTSSGAAPAATQQSEAALNRAVRPASSNRGATDAAYWQERLRRAREANQPSQNAQ